MPTGQSVRRLPDRREREHAVDAGAEQRGDVGAVVDPVRRRPRVEAVALEHERAADVEHRDPAVLDAPAVAGERGVAQRGSGDHTEGHRPNVRAPRHRGVRPIGVRAIGQPEASARQSAG